MTSTPNSALIAAAPVLVNVINEFQIFVTTVLTGDPAQIAIRFDAASKVFLGMVELQLPGLATAEIALVQSDITAKLAAWKASLTSMIPAKA